MAIENGSANAADVVIGLLGRIAFPGEKLRDIVTRAKRNPNAYVQVYNACNGKHTVSQIAPFAISAICRKL